MLTGLGEVMQNTTSYNIQSKAPAAYLQVNRKTNKKTWEWPIKTLSTLSGRTSMVVASVERASLVMAQRLAN